MTRKRCNGRYEDAVMAPNGSTCTPYFGCGLRGCPCPPERRHSVIDGLHQGGCGDPR